MRRAAQDSSRRQRTWQGQARRRKGDLFVYARSEQNRFDHDLRNGGFEEFRKKDASAACEGPSNRGAGRDASRRIREVNDPYEKMTVFEQIESGLRDAIAWSRGELSLKTTILPEPPPRLRRSAITALRKKMRMS